uniref:C-type lectin domain-containing protein n=1 Tax=Periophthalmus magnuspinnatus TaxID=409849 RepID=A0A3B4ACM3_9GOBI
MEDMLIYSSLLNTPRSWFGLMRNSTDRTKWQWSGGAAVTKFFWGPNEPNGQDNGEDVAMMDNNGWYDVGASRLYPFICYKVHAIRKRMTWYDALRYCRQNHGDLASVASETEMMLIKHELSKELSTQNVWTGLQYLVDSWQWMDGQPFSYESWGPDPKPTCPDIHWACGALRVEGQSQDSLTKVQGVVGWNALYCNQSLHFLCY